MNTFANLSAKQLRQAAQIKERIDSLETELVRLLGTGNSGGTTTAPRRRRMTAAGVARIRAAQKARWARVRANSARKPRRRMSAAAKARLAAVARARWKRAKAAGKSTL